MTFQTAATPTPTAGITVTQGPDWLAQLLYGAPPWLNGALKVVLLVTVVGVGVRLYQRDWEIDAETQLLMGRMAGTIAAVALAVVAFRTLLEQPYLVDVAGGAAIGWSAVTVALSRRVREWVRPHLAGERSRLAGAWILLAALSVMLLDAPRTNLFGGEFVLLGIAGAMALYNIVSIDGGLTPLSDEPHDSATERHRKEE